MLSVSESPAFGYQILSGSGGLRRHCGSLQRASPSPSRSLSPQRSTLGLSVSCRASTLLPGRDFFGSWAIGVSDLSSDSKAPPTLTFNSVGEAIGTEPDSTGGGGDGFDGFGGGGGGDKNGGGRSDEGENQERENSNKKMEMSMSQKFTLGYAALVGVGGVMGYLKGGSQKSLVAGGSSALILYYVYTQLPNNPVLASTVGLGVSITLLGVMGSRFKKSGKVFPAGVVSAASFVMAGGYLHGLMRSAH